MSVYETCFRKINSCFAWRVRVLRQQTRLVFASRRKGTCRSIVTTSILRCSEKRVANGRFARGGSILSVSVFFYGEGAGVVEIPGMLDFIGWIRSLTTKLIVWTSTIGTQRDHVTSLGT